jgi:hypothetical protein
MIFYKVKERKKERKKEKERKEEIKKEKRDLHQRAASCSCLAGPEL